MICFLFGMDKQEQRLYDFIGAIAEVELPVVFKGAMITRHLLRSHHSRVMRMTKDIDADWVGTPPDMKTLEKEISRAVQKVGDYYAKSYRAYDGTKKSAGFEIRRGENIVCTLDISMRPNPYRATYRIKDIVFQGACIEKILADKICAVSSNKIFRRAKDLVDIYALCKCVSFKVDYVFDIIQNTDRTLSDFEAFLFRKNDLEHAYNKLQGVSEKPDFQQLYWELTQVFTPFMQEKVTNVSLIWQPNKIGYIAENPSFNEILIDAEERSIETGNGNENKVDKDIEYGND